MGTKALALSAASSSTDCRKFSWTAHLFRSCRIKKILAYSSHKDSEHLVEFVDDAKDTLKQVFVAMGEPKASMFLAQKLRDNLGVKAMAPEAKKTQELN